METGERNEGRRSKMGYVKDTDVIGGRIDDLFGLIGGLIRSIERRSSK